VSVSFPGGCRLARKEAMTQTTHTAFVTTSERGLRHDILPMRLYHKAKKLGVWDPRAIDFEQDIEDWQRLNENERETLLYLSSLFQAGEESVTLDLLPLMLTVAREGRLEEEMYLTTFLWEEAKHTEFFRRFLDEVAQEHSDLHRYHTPSYRKIFYEELPQRMHALLSDPSPAAQARASVVYNMIVEGVLAETGYHAYFNMLERLNILPGLREGIGYLKRDEARHLAYGVFLLSRLVAQDQTLWDLIQADMQQLLTYALGVINELFEARAAYENPPFDLQLEDYLSYATAQFQKRFERIRRACGQTLDEIYQTADEAT
jgi:ribonucleoside-diphosphate reductase beta chain